MNMVITSLAPSKLFGAFAFFGKMLVAETAFKDLSLQKAKQARLRARRSAALASYARF
jgi:hypothetical protein